MWLSAADTLTKALLVLSTLASAISATNTHEDIEISPSDMNRTIFQEGDFRKTCRYTGSGEVSELQVLHDGVVVEEVTGGSSIMLDVMEAQLTDKGLYTCRVIFTDITSINASMGALAVVDLGLIAAPADQYVVAGQDAVFECLFHDPDNLYGPSISTIRQGSQIVNVISGASVEDEGEYECDIILLEESASTLVPIRLHVFTPIIITEHPVSYQELQGVQEARFTVAFTGRESQNIAVMWFRDGITLHDTSEHQITTVFSEELMNGSTTVYFPEMDRSNEGVYRVVARTDFGEDVIDISHRRQEQSFQVEVRVPPQDPTGFEAAVVAEHHVELVWDLPISHSNEDVENFQLEISFPNGSTAVSLTLDKSARSVRVSVFPGVRYDAQLIAMNNDGRGESSLSFVTPPAAPYVTFFQSRRLNETHFNISISLLYTGGGDTTTFSVYFREQNSIEWSSNPIMIVVLDSVLALEYHGVVTAEEIRGKGPLEFELRVENGLGFMNRSGSGLEISDPPGAPTTPMVSEKSDTSVTLDFTLPEEGTPPFINVILEFSEPVVMQRNFSGNYMPGQTVKKQVGNLSPLTAYTLKARAVNYAGNGPSSDTINFITDEAQPTSTPKQSSLPLEVIGAGVGGVALIVVAVAVCICCCCYYCKKRRRRRERGKDNKYMQKGTQPQDQADLERGTESEKDQLHQGKDHPHPSSTDQNSSEKTDRYITVQHVQHVKQGRGPPSTASSSSPSSHKRPLERGHNNQASSSTLNSGASATGDSFMKRQDLLSSSEIQLSSLQSSQQGYQLSSLQSSQQGYQLSSLQSSQQGYQTSRDNLGYKRQKVINPSISSSEATTETAELTTPFLQPQVEETYSFQSLPFIPEGSCNSSLAYSTDQSQRHYGTNV